MVAVDVGKVTIGNVVDQMASDYPDHDALVYYHRGLRYTYKEFCHTCNQVAKGFMSLGVERGENVAIWANNVSEWVLAQFGTAKMGAVLVTVNTNYRAFELEYLLKQSDSTTIILTGGVRTSDEYVKIMYDLCPELNHCQPGQLDCKRLPKLKNVIFIGEEKLPGMYNWIDILEMSGEVTDEELSQREQVLEPDDVINMQYTSGTTGFPKGVMLTHTNIIGNAVSQAECMRFSPADRLCIPVPFFHCFGCVMGTLLCVVSGATMVPVEKFEAVKVLETIEAEKCTAVHGVPTMFIAELEALKNKNYDTSSLRTGIMAGAPCPTEVMKSVVNLMGASEICITYGQTEASPGITMTRTSDPIELRVSTVGRALPNVEVKIVNPENGEDLQPGVQGELCTRGYHVMKGYYNMPEATASTMDKDNWLHTGDLAVMDVDGYCKITGRLKDMIIRGGENIYPREIEEFLYTHPKVKDVQVVGIASEKYGEEVVAFVQVKGGEGVNEDELRDFCKNQISFYKIPACIFFVDEYPTTASGKIQKFKLRELAMKELNREKDVSIDMT